jgi:hypothetical protein
VTKDKICIMLKSGKYCESLSQKFSANIGCYRAGEKECAYKTYYDHFSKIDNATPELSSKVNNRLKDKFFDNWKARSQKKHTNDKSVLSVPFEHVLREILNEELGKIGVVITNKSREVAKGCRINADAIAEKEGYPTCIFSFKTWIGLEQIRETFAYAYLAKESFGKENIRVYELGFIKVGQVDNWIKACGPFLDGVFYLTEKPFLDDLITELTEMYSEPKGG